MRNAFSEEIYKHMGDKKAKIILSKMSHLGQVNMDVIRPLIVESYELMVERNRVIGGKSLPGKLYQKSYGSSLFEEDQSGGQEFQEKYPKLHFSNEFIDIPTHTNNNNGKKSNFEYFSFYFEKYVL